MIPHGVEIFVSLEPIDLRWGLDRLAGIVQERIEREAQSGALFVFFGKRRHALKIFFCDSTGMCLFYKRLSKGLFRLPEKVDKNTMTVSICERALDDLLDGIDIDTPAKRASRSRVLMH